MSRDRGRGLGGRRGSWRRWRGPGCGGGGGGGGGGPRPPGREGGEADGAERVGPAAFTLCTCSGRPTDPPLQAAPPRPAAVVARPGACGSEEPGPGSSPAGNGWGHLHPWLRCFRPPNRAEIGAGTVGRYGAGLQPPFHSPVRLGSYSPPRPDPPGLSLDRVLRCGTGEGVEPCPGALRGSGAREDAVPSPAPLLGRG